MKTSRLLPIVGAIVAALTVVVIVEAQPVGPVGIPRVVTNSPGLLAGSGTTVNPLTATIHTGGIISGTGSSGSPLTATEVGDISSVTAGTGLTGGGTSGAVTLNVDPTVVQSRVSSTCSAPNAIRAVAQDGTVTCTTGTGSVTSIDSGGGLTGGPVTTTGTFAVGAGTNITVNADDVQVADAFDQSASGKSTTVGDVRGTEITPTLSSNQNDWAPTGYATATVISVTLSGGSHNLTGLQGGVQGRRITIRNTCVSINCNINIPTESVSSSAANRFFTGNNGDTAGLVLQANDSVDFEYLSSEWRLVRSGSFDYANFSNAVAFAGTGVFSGGLLTANAGFHADGTVNLATSNGSTTVGNFVSTVLTDTISADQNDYAPTGNATATVFDITPSGASRTITGLTGGVAGRRITIHNANAIAGNSVFLTSQDSSSTAANRFITPDNITQTIYAKDSLNLFYNGASSRWEVEKSKGFADLRAQTLTVNGATGLGTTNIIGTLTTTDISNSGTNTFNATAGSSTFSDLRAQTITDTISADQNDYTPPGATPTKALMLELTITGATRTITGLTGGAAGRLLYIHNACASAQSFVVVGSSGSSTAANRFQTDDFNSGNASRIFRPCSGSLFTYMNSRWTQISSTAGYNLVADNNLTSNGTANIAGQLTAGTVASTNTYLSGPTQLASTTSTLSSEPTNDFSMASQNVMVGTNIDPSGSNRTITGMANGQANRWVFLRNTSSTYKITLTNADGASLSANQFTLPGGSSYVIYPERTVWLIYVGSKWLVFDNTSDDTRTLPTISSCGSGATRTGGAFSGTVTVGTGATGCTITFVVPLGGTPSCTWASRSNKHMTYSVSTTALTFTNVDDPSSTLIDFDCKGH